MSSLSESIAQVRSMLKLQSADVALTDRAIAAELKNVASKLIRRETNLRKLLNSPNIFTTIPCLEMEEVPLSECCSYRSDCTISRSKYQLPKIGENIRGLLVQRIGGQDFREDFKASSPSRYVNLLSLGLKKKDVHYWVVNDYLYVTEPSISLISITAYFEEDVPSDLLACNGDIEECPKNPLDQEFKVPGYLEADVLSIVRTNIEQMYKRNILDRTSNDIEEEGGKA